MGRSFIDGSAGATPRERSLVGVLIEMLYFTARARGVRRNRAKGVLFGPRFPPGALVAVPEQSYALIHRLMLIVPRDPHAVEARA